jgi:CheY-like chemotaxis protein
VNWAAVHWQSAAPSRTTQNNAVDLDSIFFMRTPAGEQSHADPRVTMSPAFRRMLGELDGKKSLADLARVFPQLDAEDLRLWVSELVRQKLIKRAPTLTISQRMRLAQPAAKVEKQLSQIAEKIEPWLEGRVANGAAPSAAPLQHPATAQFVRTARLAAIEANTTAASIGREGYFMNPETEHKPLAARAQRLILVVEDDEIQASIVGKILEKEGYQVRLAHSGAAVISTLRERPTPDLVLLDVELPDTDGFKILEQLRAHRDFKQIRVVMVTGRTDRADIAKGVLLGADGYLTKPFRPDMIKVAVRRALAPA